MVRNGSRKPSQGMDLLRMGIIDEGEGAAEKFGDLFGPDFEVRALDPDCLNERQCADQASPHMLLYVCRDHGEIARERIERIRFLWPRTIVILLMPAVQGEDQIREATYIPAHKVVFKPHSRQRIYSIVENYRSLIIAGDGQGRGDILLSCLMELAGGMRPELYVAYNRLTPFILSICEKLGCDWRRVQRVFTLFLVLLSNMDDQSAGVLMRGAGSKKGMVRDAYNQLRMLADLLSMSEPTEGMGEGLKYVLKRYDGQGLPDDDVSGGDIPGASRIVRVLLDYNSLLQDGKSVAQALSIMRWHKDWYDPEVLGVLANILGEEGRQYTREVYPLGLTPGMVVAEDVYGEVDGKRVKVISRNEVLSEDAVDYLQRHSDDILDITEPIKIVEDTAEEVTV